MESPLMQKACSRSVHGRVMANQRTERTWVHYPEVRHPTPIEVVPYYVRLAALVRGVFPQPGCKEVLTCWRKVNLL